MKVERALAWYCDLLLGSHQHLILATVGRDGLPQLARVAYGRDGDDLYLGAAADSPLAAGLDPVGPVAGLLVGGDGIPLVSVAGAAELVADPDAAARIRATLPGDTSAVYRLLPDSLLPLQGAMAARTVPDGEAVVRQGELADRFYVVLDGECEVSRVAGGAPESLARLHAGDFFGESGLLAGAPRNASVHARGEATVISLSRSAFSIALHRTGTNPAGLAKTITQVSQG